LKFLSPHLNRYADTGIHVENYFDGAGGTNPSLYVMMTAIPTLLHIPHIKQIRTHEFDALAKFMLSQGYHTQAHMQITIQNLNGRILGVSMIKYLLKM